MTPSWKSDFLYATLLAERFGMKESIDSSPGWSETGGPWVKPSQGMKKYVWSKVIVEGGQPFVGRLPAPPDTTGPFQNEAIGSNGELHAVPSYYADSAVVAYRLPSTDVTISSLHPMMTCSGGAPDYAMLTDGDLVKTTSVAIPPQGEDAWIQYTFPHPVSLRAVTIVTLDPSRAISATYGIAAPQKSVEASEDGQTWHTIATLETERSPETTVSFPRGLRQVFSRDIPSRDCARTTCFCERGEHWFRTHGLPDCGARSSSRRAREPL